MCNDAVPHIPLHRYKRNWPITCDLPEILTVLCGVFIFLSGIYPGIIGYLSYKFSIRISMIMSSILT